MTQVVQSDLAEENHAVDAVFIFILVTIPTAGFHSKKDTAYGGFDCENFLTPLVFFSCFIPLVRSLKMKSILIPTLVLGALASVAHAAPVALNDGHLDRVTAGYIGTFNATTFAATTAGATTMRATTVGATTVGATTVRATTLGATTVGATTVKATTLGATTVGATTVKATTLGATTLGTTTLGATTMGATTLGATTLGATTSRGIVSRK